ncbi:putative RNA-dependent RNA polymerase [Culex permutotetra-like virus]|nr:putative RNA-dependent RNA polymerase [Culex permutotetra-like virus]
MDASNPVNSAQRYTLAELRDSRLAFKRQDLKALQAMAASADRTLFSSGGPDKTDFHRLTMDLNEHLVSVREELAKDSRGPITFLNQLPPVPVDNTKCGDRQIHPSMKNSAKGYVSVNRTFGNAAPCDLLLAEGALTAFSHDEIMEARKKRVYCAGTHKTFLDRTKLLLSRKCKSPYKHTVVAQKLQKLMPVGVLPDWTDVDDLLERVKITKAAGAGAPYWKEKGEAFDECMQVILPQIIKAVNDGTVGQLARGRPEWFLVELKNKTDRYDLPVSKTRPYGCFPFHWTLLFSCIVQPFCEALQVWTDSKTCNAYGMSFCSGNLKKWFARVESLLETAQRKKKDMYMMGVYGDDCRIVQAKAGGGAVVVDPDMKQHDGAIDTETISGTVKWIYDMYAKQHGDSKFWEFVLQQLAIFACDPNMVIDGSTVYTKKVQGGLISGVPGTTLFGCAKSVLAYSALLDECMFDKTLFADEAKVGKYLMEKHGCTLKEGTWRPSPMNLTQADGTYLCESKFLGMRLMWRTSERFPDPFLVPTLKDDEWLELIMCPRASEDKKASNLAAQRTSFDRICGLLLCGAVYSDRVSKALHAAVDLVPATAVLLSTQLDGKRGLIESPNDLIVSDDFIYPSTAGIPGLDFCDALYNLDAEHRGDSKFESVYPTLDDFINSRKEVHRSRFRYIIHTPIKSKPAEQPPQAPRTYTHKMTGKTIVLPEPTPRERSPAKEVKEQPAPVFKAGEPIVTVTEEFTDQDLENMPLPPLPNLHHGFARGGPPVKAGSLHTKDGKTVAPRHELQRLEEYIGEGLKQNAGPLVAKEPILPTGMVRNYQCLFSVVLDKGLIWPHDIPENSHDNAFVSQFAAINGLKVVPTTSVIDPTSDMKGVWMSLKSVDGGNTSYDYAQLTATGCNQKKMQAAINHQFAAWLKDFKDSFISPPKKVVKPPKGAPGMMSSNWAAEVESDDLSRVGSLSEASQKEVARLVQDILRIELPRLLQLNEKSTVIKASDHGEKQQQQRKPIDNVREEEAERS